MSIDKKTNSIRMHFPWFLPNVKIFNHKEINMKKYEAVIILNPNLSTKVEDFVKDFQKLLKNNSFNIQKKEEM